MSSHRDSVGPIARSVEDAAAILTVIAGRDRTDNYTWTAPAKIPDYSQHLRADAIRGKRFGVPRAALAKDPYANDPSISIAFNKALEIIRSLGGVVIDPAYSPSADQLEHASRTYGELVYAVDVKVGNLISAALIYIDTLFRLD